MRHCCEFRADEIYYLAETNLCVSRKLSIGFCPICEKPVAELVEISFTGSIERQRFAGIKANDILLTLKDQILYSSRQCNYLKMKSKPYGWKYGVNKAIKINGKERVRQYAYDFYGNKEIVKII